MIDFLLNKNEYHCPSCYNHYDFDNMELVDYQIVCFKCAEHYAECLYCGEKGYATGWVSERCRKEGVTENMKDHPECQYKGFICGGCEWFGEQMCFKCQKFNNFYQGNNENN
eukprot:SAG11_NODE_5981_length_1419_cov_1.612879_4_plen_112_part_00